MTASPALNERRRKKQRGARSLAGSLAEVCEGIAEQAELGRIVWPTDKYRRDPVGFCKDILGVELWSRQIEVLEAFAAVDEDGEPVSRRIAVTSGHKVGKSRLSACAALWFYCSFPDARVLLTSSVARQVDSILWREITKLHAMSGTCLDCRKDHARRCKEAEKRKQPSPPPPPRPCPHSTVIGGEIGKLARTGLHTGTPEDQREITGFTARTKEAVAGISGGAVFYIPDEASGVDDEIFEAMSGNMAGGGRMLMLSNPTRTEGEFYEAWNRKEQFYKTFQISSEESPNVVAGRTVIPGLCGADWIEEKKLEWGEDSPLYKIRVKGEFVEEEDGKILTVHAIRKAEERWHDPETPTDGPLFIGVDPAGASGSGDDSGFALRRGMKVLSVEGERGLDEEGHLRKVLAICKEHHKPREPLPVVVIDSEGPIGVKVYYLLKAHADRRDAKFRLVRVRSSVSVINKKSVDRIYDRVRDELWGNLERWIRDGGAIPEDAKLSKELHAPSWVNYQRGSTSILKVTPKSDLKKMLDRSPDRADAVTLAVWVPSSMRDDEGDDAGEKRAAAAADDDDFGGGGDDVDPYTGAIDPYGGGFNE